MNKSIAHRLMDLERRVKALEDAPKTESVVKIEPDVNAILAELRQLADTTPHTLPKPARNMCPKCGVKPNYFFHVKTCNGQQKEQKNADTDRRRDQGKT